MWNLVLKDQMTKQEYREQLLKIMQETLVLFSSADIDQLLLQSSRAIFETSEIVLGHKYARDMPRITQEVVDMSNKKRTLRNKQDRGNKDRFKQLKHHVEKKTRQALEDMIIKKCQQCKEDFQRGNLHLMFKHAKELANHEDTKCLELLDKTGLLKHAQKSTKFDGKMAHWYHMDCFFIRQRPKGVTEIEHFESLRYEDQEKIRVRVTSSAAIGAPAKAKKGKKGDIKLRDYAVEYAKSSRAACKGCQEKIEKDDIRISKKNYDSDAAKRYGPHDDWHHVDCFTNLREDLGFVDSVEVIPGFHALSPDDRKMLKGKLKAISG
ncbi:hypothetical protein QYM36_012964, partial [Artemia franciscana]